jgi:ATP-dependent phosphoenolpyruvate carboxykinase
VITGTWYGGEMKKGVFSMMNYTLHMSDFCTVRCTVLVVQAVITGMWYGGEMKKGMFSMMN